MGICQSKNPKLDEKNIHPGPSGPSSLTSNLSQESNFYQIFHSLTPSISDIKTSVKNGAKINNIPISELELISNNDIRKYLFSQKLIYIIHDNDLSQLQAFLNYEFELDSIHEGPQFRQWTVLTYAVLRGYLNMVISLIERKADVNTPSGRKSHGYCPLYIAAQNKHENILSVLLENSASIYTVNGPHHWTSLHIAAAKGHLDILNILVQHGANVQIRDKNGHFPLMLSSDLKVIDYLKPLTLSQGDMISEQLIESIGESQNETFFSLLSLDPNLDYISQTGIYRYHTPLSLACSMEEEKIVKILLEKGANPNFLTGDSFTCLYRVCQSGSFHLAELLLQHGADVNMTSDSHYCRSALHIAAANGYLDIVQLLIKNHGDINQKDSAGKIPVDYASGQKLTEYVRNLIFDDNSILNEQMIDAIGICDSKTIRDHLDDNPESINYASKHGPWRKWTPLNLAISRGNDTIVDILLETLRGANVNLSSIDNYSPLYRAAEKGHSELVSRLLSKGSDINYLNGPQQWTALHISCANNNVEVAKILIENKANIHIKDKMGRCAWDLVDDPKNKPLFQPLFSSFSE